MNTGIFILILVIGIILFIFVGILLADDNIPVMLLMFFLGSCITVCLVKIFDDAKNTSKLKCDSTKNYIVTDTTFVMHNNQIDTLITYQLKEKDFENNEEINN